MLNEFKDVDLANATFDSLDNECQRIVQERVSVALGIPTGNAADHVRSIPESCQAGVIELVAKDVNWQEIKAELKAIPDRIRIQELQAANRAAKQPAAPPADESTHDAT